MSETSLPATLANAFNTTENAFALHDVSSIMNQSGASIRSNPFNDSVSAFNESVSSTKMNNSTSPKKDSDYLNNNGIGAIFSSYSAASNEFINGVGSLKQDFNSAKNPFTATTTTTAAATTEKNNTWNELNALDLNKLRFELNNDEHQSSIFANAQHSEQMIAKAEMKKEIPVDLFKDVAKAAFNEFGEFNSTRHKNNEFFNKITGFDCVRT